MKIFKAILLASVFGKNDDKIHPNFYRRISHSSEETLDVRDKTAVEDIKIKFRYALKVFLLIWNTVH